MPKMTKTNSSGVSERNASPVSKLDLGPLLTRKEVAARTTLSDAQIDLMVERGEFPPFCRPGGPGSRKLFMPEKVLNAWLESRVEVRNSMRTLLDPVHPTRWSFRLPSGELPAGLRVLRLPEVLRRVRYGKSEIYRRMANRTFPWPVPLSERCRGWLAHEVDEWISRCQSGVYGGPIVWKGGTSLRDAERGGRSGHEADGDADRDGPDADDPRVSGGEQ